MMRKLVWVYPFTLLLYAVYSYTQTDPNLVLSNNRVYWAIQQWMWRVGYHERLWSTLWYTILVVGLYASYLFVLHAVRTRVIALPQVRWLIVSSVAALLLSYPALSHDIFNYLFNAKMVLRYRANPHVSVALDYPRDDWLKFMHNTHTPAPYGYGFTLISLVPSALGFEHLKLTLFLYRLMMIGAFLAVLRLQWRLTSREQVNNLAWFGLNPLILIEIVGNVHNDLIMMALALTAWSVGQRAYKKHQWGWLAVAVGLWIASVSIKFASVVMAAGLGMFLVGRLLKLPLRAYVLQVVAHLTPLLTHRSQRFLPWYLSWAMSFVPMTHNNFIMESMTAASVAGLLSYVPYLYKGEYSPQLLWVRTLICFLPPISFALTRLVLGYYPGKKRHEAI